MYNEGNINLTYRNGELLVERRNMSRNNITDFKPSQKVRNTSGDDRWVHIKNWPFRYDGVVQPSCEGYIIFDDNKQETFEYSEENKEIVWTVPDTRDKWIKG